MDMAYFRKTEKYNTNKECVFSDIFFFSVPILVSHLNEWRSRFYKTSVFIASGVLTYIQGVFEGNGKPFEFKIELQINVSKTSQLWWLKPLKLTAIGGREHI